MTSDPLSNVLRYVQMRGAVSHYVGVGHPWSIRVPPASEVAAAVMPGAEHVMEFNMMARGRGWAIVEGRPPVQLAEGDTLVFTQGESHVLCSSPDVPAQRGDTGGIWTAAGPCALLPGGLLSRPHPGHAGTGHVPDAVVVRGFLGFTLKPFNPVAAALPRLLHLPAARSSSWMTSLFDPAGAASGDTGVGSTALLERLCELVFVDSVRRYLDSLSEGNRGWFAGLRDRYVGRALNAIHSRPAHPWTVEELGRTVGLSRSALHERFMNLLGQAPSHYMTCWRMQLGSQLLRGTQRPVAAVANEVGYTSEAAFSRAFKRLVGQSPAAWRRQWRHAAQGMV